MTLTAITELTEGTLNGNGAFDKLMAAGRVHLQEEYKNGRLRGPEYSQVYLAMIESAMQGGLNWLVQGAKLDLERQLLTAQVSLAQVQAQIAAIELQKVGVELEMLELQKPKIAAETAMLVAQKAQVLQTTLNAIAEGENIPKQGLVLTAQEDEIQQRTLMLVNQTANEVIQGTVLVAQECKLRAEFDLIANQIEKSSSEVNLLVQKTMTERAQTQSMGVDTDSVIGRQKELYTAQKDGFKRDAEQKAAKLMIDTWNARRVSDPATVADATNKLDDQTIGQFVQVLKTGVGV